VNGSDRNCLALLLRTKGRCDMHRCGDFQNSVQSRSCWACSPMQARNSRHSTDVARPVAIHECDIKADKYSPITQLPDQFAVYGTCMTNRRQRFG
jgi:hypothetical protein